MRTSKGRVPAAGPPPLPPVAVARSRVRAERGGVRRCQPPGPCRRHGAAPLAAPGGQPRREWPGDGHGGCPRAGGGAVRGRGRRSAGPGGAAGRGGRVCVHGGAAPQAWPRS